MVCREIPSDWAVALSRVQHIVSIEESCYYGRCGAPTLY